MKLLMENWRKKLNEYEIHGVEGVYEPATADPPASEQLLDGATATLHKALTTWAEDWKADFAGSGESVFLDRLPPPRREKLLSDLLDVFDVWSGKTLGPGPTPDSSPEEIV